MPQNVSESLTQKFIRQTEAALNRALINHEDPYQAYIDLVDQIIREELRSDRGATDFPAQFKEPCSPDDP